MVQKKGIGRCAALMLLALLTAGTVMTGLPMKAQAATYKRVMIQSLSKDRIRYYDVDYSIKRAYFKVGKLKTIKPSKKIRYYILPEEIIDMNSLKAKRVSLKRMKRLVKEYKDEHMKMLALVKIKKVKGKNYVVRMEETLNDI